MLNIRIIGALQPVGGGKDAAWMLVRWIISRGSSGGGVAGGGEQHRCIVFMSPAVLQRSVDAKCIGGDGNLIFCGVHALYRRDDLQAVTGCRSATGIKKRAMTAFPWTENAM